MSGQQPILDGRRGPVPKGCLYVDESYSKQWQYIGVLAVPDRDAKALLSVLHADREATQHFSELRFHDITNVKHTSLASRWLDHAQCASSPRVRFHVLGVDLRTLN